MRSRRPGVERHQPVCIHRLTGTKAPKPPTSSVHLPVHTWPAVIAFSTDARGLSDSGKPSSRSAPGHLLRKMVNVGSSPSISPRQSSSTPRLRRARRSSSSSLRRDSTFGLTLRNRQDLWIKSAWGCCGRWVRRLAALRTRRSQSPPAVTCAQTRTRSSPTRPSRLPSFAFRIAIRPHRPVHRRRRRPDGGPAPAPNGQARVTGEKASASSTSAARRKPRAKKRATPLDVCCGSHPHCPRTHDLTAAQADDRAYVEAGSWVTTPLRRPLGPSSRRPGNPPTVRCPPHGHRSSASRDRSRG